MAEIFSNVGDRIQMLLSHYNLKQIKLSDETGISANAISNYINNNRIPDTSSIYKIAKVLNTSIEWLLTGEGEMLASNVSTSPKPVEIPPFAIEELNGEQKELLMAFSCLDGHGKYAVKNFTIFQMTQQNLTQTSSSSPPLKNQNNTGEIA